MDYKVIVVTEKYQFTAVEELTKMVKNHLDKGWKLHGGVSVSRSDLPTSQRTVMAQAMIKE